MVNQVEEMSLESPREMQDEQEVGNHSFMERGGRRAREPLMVKVAMSGRKRKVPEGKAKRQGKKVERLRARKGKLLGRNPKKHKST